MNKNQILQKDTHYQLRSNSAEWPGSTLRIRTAISHGQ